MSMAGGNPSLIIDTLVNTAQLGTSLRQAEAQVAQSTAAMARHADQFSQKWATGLQGAFMKFAGPMFAVQVADQFARSFSDGLSKNQTFVRTLEDFNYKIANSLPIFGPLFQRQQQAYEIEGQGMSVTEAFINLLTSGRIPVPEILGGGNFQLGPGGGFVPAEGEQREAQLQARIQRLQGALQQAQPQPSRGEMLSEQLSRQMGGAMGQAQTALGTFKFAQMGADQQAEIAKSVAKQVDLMIQIRDATEELRKLTASN